MTAVLTCQACITKHFWTEIIPDIVYDWSGFFSTEKERDWSLFQSVLLDFVDASRKLLQNKYSTTIRYRKLFINLLFRWPIAVGRILLNNSKQWEDILLTDEIYPFFDSIAALQAALVQQTVGGNCEALEAQLARRNVCF